MNNNSRVKIQTRSEYGTLVLVMTGIVDLAGIREVRHAMFRGLVTDNIERVLSDFSKAEVKLSEEDWTAISQQSSSPHAVRVKAAILIAPELARQAWRHCELLNRKGHIRIAFTDPEAAYQWAQVRRVPRPGQPRVGARRSKRAP